ncbi:hypothetical protein [Roseibium sp. SCP14]|uniref:hypothetical protein n=1 Tax=Roseibium sp. SCP14 TaxID=3141375 RepID=UPI00333C46B8
MKSALSGANYGHEEVANTLNTLPKQIKHLEVKKIRIRRSPIAAQGKQVGHKMLARKLLVFCSIWIASLALNDKSSAQCACGSDFCQNAPWVDATLAQKKKTYRRNTLIGS